MMRNVVAALLVESGWCSLCFISVFGSQVPPHRVFIGGGYVGA